MKNLYLALFLLLVQVSIKAQNVSIPDSNFKNKLLSLGVDLNNDGEIQQSEALQVEELDISNGAIASLTGIESFTNLKRLNCNNNTLTSLSFDTSGLYELRCNHNQLTTLNTLSINTQELDVSYNQLSTLTLPNSVDYNYLDISGNLYTSVVFNDVKLKYFYCNDTKLSALDFSNVRQLSETISIKDNPKLISINFKNGKFDLCYVINGGCHFYLILSNNPSLTYMCADDFNHEGPTVVTETEYFQTYYNLTNIKFNTYCTPNPQRELSVASQTIKSEQNYSFYPNPVQDVLNIKMENIVSVSSINIYNTLGQLVKNFKNPMVSDHLTLSLSELKTGTYILEVNSENGKMSKKLIKK